MLRREDGRGFVIRILSDKPYKVDFYNHRLLLFEMIACAVLLTKRLSETVSTAGVHRQSVPCQTRPLKIASYALL